LRAGWPAHVVTSHSDGGHKPKGSAPRGPEGRRPAGARAAVPRLGRPINTAYIERPKVTFRELPATL